MGCMRSLKQVQLLVNYSLIHCDNSIFCLVVSKDSVFEQHLKLQKYIDWLLSCDMFSNYLRIIDWTQSVKKTANCTHAQKRESQKIILYKTKRITLAYKIDIFCFHTKTE